MNDATVRAVAGAAAAATAGAASTVTPSTDTPVTAASSRVFKAAVPGDVRRQVMVILSGGSDTASLTPFDDVLDVAKRSGVAIYSVSLRPPAVGLSGGRAFFRLDPDPREDGQVRQMQVRMRHPDGAHARTRPGYFATHHPAATQRRDPHPQEGVSTQ